MRFSCQVQVVNYKMPVSHPNSQPRAKRSTLTLGGYGGSNGGKLWILHQNSQNGSGVRYKINSNVITMHIKFLREGKTTIRLKEPTVDLRISGEPTDVSKFAKVIGEFIAGKPLSSVGPMKLANLETVSKKMEPPPVKYLEIMTAKQLQLVKNGYPTTLNELVVSQVGMTVVDPKIFRLPHLQILRLECNQVSKIPKSIELLSGLTQLYLKGNCLGCSKRPDDWDWLKCRTIQTFLKVLDLSSNQLVRLPNTVAHLQALTTLKLDDNMLVTLPNNLGFTKNLRTLSFKKNNLCYVPASLALSRIEAMDISENNFSDTWDNLRDFCRAHVWENPLQGSHPIMLKDFAASAVLSLRLKYDEKVLPRELILDLDSACYCLCGRATFPSFPSQFLNVSPRKLASCVTYDQTNGVTLGFRFCMNPSAKCAGTKLK